MKMSLSEMITAHNILYNLHQLIGFLFFSSLITVNFDALLTVRSTG
jgi:hypothetical protein